MAKEPKKLEELFHDTLKDIYFAEKKILSALPKIAKAAQNEDLKAAFQKHESWAGLYLGLNAGYGLSVRYARAGPNVGRHNRGAPGQARQIRSKPCRYGLR
jgi:Domain of unknown function (DUF892)